MSATDIDKTTLEAAQISSVSSLESKAEKKDKSQSELDLPSKVWIQDNEIRLLRGKIKGYETLGSLYQEKIHEVSMLKEKLHELESQRDSITGQFSLRKPEQKSLSQIIQQEPLLSTAQAKQDDRANQTASSAENLHQLAAQAGDPATQNRANSTKSLALMSMEEDEETERILSQHCPTPPASNDLSATTSSSYKILNSRESTSPSMVRERPVDDWNIPGAQQLLRHQTAENRQRSTSFRDMIPSALQDESQMNSNAELSISTREELSKLILAGELDGSMIKYMLKCAKLEKQHRTTQALLNTMVVENQDLKSENEKLNVEMCNLRQELKELAKQTRLSKMNEVSEAVEEEEPVPADWVHIEKDQKQGSEPTEKEVELRKRVDKLKQHAKELLQANTSWDSHCRRLNIEHEEAIGDLREKLQRSQQKIESYKAIKERKLQEAQTLLNERDEAIRKCNEECQKRRESEQQWEIQRRRAEQLDAELKEQSEIIHALTEERRSLMSMHERNLTQQEVVSEMELLKQQVSVYKDDFDNERRDRERAQTEKNALTRQLREANDNLRTLKDQMRQKEQELGRIVEEKNQCQNRLRDAKVEMRRIQSVLGGSQPSTVPPRYTPSLYQPNQIMYPPQQPPPYQTRVLQTPQVVGSSRRSWPCKTCTYDNPEVRVTCEMCGSTRFRDHNVPTTVENMDTQAQCMHAVTSRGYDQCDTGRPSNNAAELSALSEVRPDSQFSLTTVGLDGDVTEEKREEKGEFSL